jgi:peptidoglycan/LPS O-acetylase OafA/YrhL
MTPKHLSAQSPATELQQIEVPSTHRVLRFPALDGLRGLAALAVVSTHVGFQTGRTAQGGAVGWLLARGDYGVTVFFLLSGFLLYRPFVGGVSRVASYARRRASRVLPLYYVAVVAALVLLPDNDHAGTSTWVHQLLLVQIYPGSPLPAGLTQMWSLCTEVAFYVVLPLLAAAIAWLARRGADELLALGGLAVVGVLWTCFSAGHGLPPSSHVWLPGYLDWFALGMALAVLHARGGTERLWELGRAPGTCLAVATLLFLLSATAVGGPKLLDPPTTWEAVVKHLLYGASALWVLLPAVFAPEGGSALSRVAASRPLHALGTVSYSVFALHLVVLHFVIDGVAGGPFHGSFGTVWLVTAAASVAVSAVTYRFVEKPLIALGRR